MSLVEFVHNKNYELIKMENFLLILWVFNVPKTNLRKFFTIYRESLILSLQNRFFLIFLRFLVIDRDLVIAD